MGRIYIVSGVVKEHNVVYGYFQTEAGALGNLHLQADSFGSKGFKIEYMEPIPGQVFGEIWIWRGDAYYGSIKVTTSWLND